MTLVTLNSRKRKEGRAVVGLLLASHRPESSSKAGRLRHSVPSSKGQPAWENLTALGLDQDGLPCLTALGCIRSLQSEWKSAKHRAPDWILGFWSILVTGFAPPEVGWSLQEQGTALHSGPLSRYQPLKRQTHLWSNSLCAASSQRRSPLLLIFPLRQLLLLSLFPDSNPIPPLGRWGHFPVRPQNFVILTEGAGSTLAPE